MPSFVHGIQSRIYLHNFDLSGYVEGVEMELTRSVAETRPLSETNVRRVAGHRSARIALTGGPLAVGATDNDPWVFARRADIVPRAFAFLPYGDLLNRGVYLGQMWGNSQQRTAGDDVVRLPVALLSTDRAERGLILRALASGGASPGSKSPASGGAPSSFGGAGYLLVTALTGTLTVTIEDSADGTTDWQPIIAFTAQTTGAPLSQAKECALPTTTVREYTRVSWTLPSGAATWFCAFARRTHN